MKKQKVSLPSELPVAHEAQVLVMGGGPGGLGAAVAAAREGADVLLVEHYGFLGGMATAGEVNPFMPNHLDSASLDTGVFEDWMHQIASYGGARGQSRVFDPNVARLAAEDLCLEAGVRLLYHHRAAHVERNGRRIEGVVLHGKSGLTIAKAETYIDSTGDGDLAAMAGCDFEYGGEGGHAQPMTLCFKLKFDRRDAPPGEEETDLYLLMRQVLPEIQEVYKRAQEDGRISCPRENVLVFRGVDDDTVHFNTTRVVHKSSIRGEELSAAEIEARKQLREIIEVFRADLPIFRHARIYSIAPQIGIRESRRIVGRNYITLDAYKAGCRFPDAVARITYPVDIHNPDGAGTLHIRLPKGVWYEVPWGCLLPSNIDNLAIGSRCISVDHAVHSSMRVMPPVCSLGQACGVAAAMAGQQGIDIANVEGTALHARLTELGRNLLPYDPAFQHDLEATPEQEEKRRLAETRAAKSFSA